MKHYDENTYDQCRYETEDIQVEVADNLQFCGTVTIGYEVEDYDGDDYQGWVRGEDIETIETEEDCGFYDFDGNLVDDNWDSVKKYISEYYGISEKCVC